MQHERRIRLLIAGWVVLKLLLLCWNVVVFDGQTYDEHHHVWRLREAGMQVHKMAYNGPVYYFSVGGPYLVAESLGLLQPIENKGASAVLLFLARVNNVGWLALFYGAWIGVILPRVTPNRDSWLAASAVLLCITGTQKVGTLTHPDNMLAGCTALGFAVWLLLREQTENPLRGRWELWLALFTGMLGSIRPFAVVPVLVIWAGLLFTARVGRTTRQWAQRALLYTVLTGVFAGGWLGLRAVRAEVVMDAYNDDYITPFVKHREDFDFVSYFTTFYPMQLLETPNRKINRQYRGPGAKWKNPYGNSFWTTAYSELWGDHWLYLSGPRMKEKKKLPKQVLLATAFPLTLALGGRLAWGIVATVKGRKDTDLAMLAMLVAGLSLYMYWQTGAGLLPGKHSTIKFLYNAHLVPFALALAFLRPVTYPRAWVGMAALITLISLPYLVFVPSWMLP